MKKIYIILFTLCMLFINYYGCKDEITGEDLDKVVIPDTLVSYIKYIQPVFNIKCTFSGCHDDITRAKNLSLTTWSNARVAGIVNPGDPETSRMVWAVEGRLGATLMPPLGYPALTANQVRGIRQWILEGAPNN